MNIVYRKLTTEDIDMFIDMRINQLRAIALDGEKTVGTSGISFVEKPPYFSCPSGKIALLSSMFTADDYRRKGIAKHLLAKVIDEAKNFGCSVVQITASDMGVLLYTDFGFKKNGNFMQYNL